jgi:hypothetical protein
MSKSSRPPCSDRTKVIVCRFRTFTGKVTGRFAFCTWDTHFGQDEVEWILRGNRLWGSFKAYPDRKKQRAVSRFRTYVTQVKQILDYVVIPTWLRLVKMNVGRTHPWLDIEVCSNRKTFVVGLLHSKCDRFLFCCRNHLVPVKKDFPGSHPWMNL